MANVLTSHKYILWVYLVSQDLIIVGGGVDIVGTDDVVTLPVALPVGVGFGVEFCGGLAKKNCKVIVLLW